MTTTVEKKNGKIIWIIEEFSRPTQKILLGKCVSKSFFSTFFYSLSLSFYILKQIKLYGKDITKTTTTTLSIFRKKLKTFSVLINANKTERVLIYTFWVELVLLFFLN